MRILHIELKEYQRLLLNNIHYIKITPESKLQLILGTNGSGKSALLRELSPLPANKKDYGSGGYKKISIRKGSSLYYLSSDFSGDDPVYSFIKDDVELNPGHKLTDYRKLVFEEFNITQEVHDLIIGRLRFHGMSSGERRAWFTKLSDADYTYALQYFKRLTEMYSQMNGAMKLNQARLVQEQDKLITPEMEDILRTEIQSLSDLTAELMGMRGTSIDTKDHIHNHLTRVDTELQTRLQKFKKLIAKYELSNHLLEPGEITKQIIIINEKLQTNDKLIHDNCEKMDAQQKLIDSFHQSGMAPETDINNQTLELESKISALKDEIILPISFEQPRMVLQAYVTVTDTVKSLLHTLVPNPGNAICRASYETKILRRQTLSESLLICNKQCDTYSLQKKELEHSRAHNALECPECKHTWIKGYSDRVYQEIVEALESYIAQYEKLTKELKELEDNIEEESSYLSTVQALVLLMNNWEVLRPFWSYLLSTDALKESPRKALQMFSDLKGDLERHIQIEDIYKKLTSVIELKALMQQDRMLNLKQLIDEHDLLNTKLNALQKDNNILRKRGETLKGYSVVYKEITDLSLQLEQLLAQRDNYVEQAYTALQKTYYGQVIHAIQMEIIKKQQQISRVDIQKALIADIQNQIKELKNSTEVLKIAIKELSPNEGLIAKGMTGFINHFVQQVNAFMGKVWTYPMKLSAILPDEEHGIDLDYKFAMTVGDPTFDVPDVKEASESQKKMIDLAFTVVSMKYLHLDNAPLFLDEFASGMDNTHRESAFHMVTMLLNTMDFSQIFMISHYEESYSSLINADITVLCPHNIILPKTLAYNQNTEIN